MKKRLYILGNGVDWCELSLKGLCSNDSTILINEKLPIKNRLLNYVARIHFSQKVNQIINVPLKKIWYPIILKRLMIDKTQNNCLLIYDHNTIGGDFCFLRYLRKKVPNIHIAYIFTNFVQGSAALAKGYVNKLNDNYDLVFAFDPIDTKKYNFLYFPLIYDPCVSLSKNKHNENKAFYIGQAKDRLPMLLSIYERLISIGIKTDFNIVNVPEEKMVHKDTIHYNKPMTYSEVIKHILDSSCLIDGIQGGSTGLTIKTCEAVCFDKKLITTNKHVAEYPFYDPRYILIVESATEIEKVFFSQNNEVHYSEEGKAYFSGKRFWDYLWSEIEKL